VTYETLLVERPHHMAYVTLTRPDAPNALNTMLRREFILFFADVEHDLDVRMWSSPAPVEPFALARISRSGRNQTGRLRIGKSGGTSIFGGP
jgi:hypothetical protein